jgi:hypothetical protein
VPTEPVDLRINQRWPFELEYAQVADAEFS